MLRYAHQRGWPLSGHTTKVAINNGALRCALYCVQYGAVGLDLATVGFTTMLLIYVVFTDKSILLHSIASYLVVCSVLALFDFELSKNLVREMRVVMRCIAVVFVLYLVHNLYFFGSCDGIPQ